MFTGLIESVCKVVSAVRTAGGIRLAVNLGRTGETVESGDSIAINGVCLTIASIRGTVAEFDVSAETLSKTTLGNLKIGSPVNVERAMQVTDKFGGHFVQGHIDAVGKVKKIEKKGDSRLFVFQTNSDVLDYIIPKGSMAVDGVSLTITDVEKNGFGVAIIPATYENTIFKNYKVGDSVNIETDIICRIVKKQLDNILPNKQGLSVEKLKEMGF
jgi:riboflavin synthase